MLSNFRVAVGFSLALAGVSCSDTKDQGSLQSGGAAGSVTQTSGGSTSGGITGAGGATSGGATTAGAGTGGSATMNGGSAGASQGGSAGSSSNGACAPPSNIDQPFEKLSQTGCMDAAAPTKFASFVVPYEVNSPLWSDSADKQRGMVVPAGQKVHVRDCTKEPTLCTDTKDSGHWDFPVGTVLLKNFAFDGKLVETRLFVQHTTRKWIGYGYRWNEAQTEATIVPDEEQTITFNTGQRMVPWSYPSRKDCMKCHTPGASFSLGPQTAQLNRVVGGKNQLDTFQSLGLLDAPLPAPYPAALVTPYTSQAGSPPANATLEERARSYLHANCGNCHRPDADFFAQDYRFATSFKDTNACNVEPMKGNAGVPDSFVIKPGDPEHSLIWLRMSLLDPAVRMPQLATHQVDEQGLKLVGDWIRSLTDCPQ